MITVIFDPAGICKKEIFEPEGETLLLRWCIDKYGADGFHVPTQIYRDRIAEECEITLEDHMADGYPIQPNDHIIIVHRPQGLDPFTTAVFAVVAIASYFIASAQSPVSLAPTPTTPEIAQPTESPNNSLTAQTNIARPLQRIPDLYGKNLVFPDLIAKPYFEFINHVKFQFEFMCFGRGEFLVDEEKTGDTLLSVIEGTESTIFEPFTAPSELLDVTTSNEVNGQRLFGPDQDAVDIDIVQLRFTANNTIKGTDDQLSAFSEMTSAERFTLLPAPVVITGTGNITFNGAEIFNSSETDFFDYAVGQMLEISGSVSNDRRVVIQSLRTTNMTCVDETTGLPVSFTNETVASSVLAVVRPNSGIFTFLTYAEADLGGGITEYTITTSETTFTTLIFHENGASSFVSEDSGETDGVAAFKLIESGQNFVATVNVGMTVKNLDNNTTAEVTVVDSNTELTLDGDIMQSGQEYEVGDLVTADVDIGPFAVPGKPDQIWTDIQAPQGIQQNGKQFKITLNIILQEVDSGGTPIGSAEARIVTIADKTRDARFYTIKTIPANPGGFYQVSISRLTNNNEGVAVSDQTNWTRLAGVEDITVSDFGNVTGWFVKTQATEQAVTVQQREFNAVITRILPTYNRSENNMNTTPAPTARIADAVVEMLTNAEAGNKPLSQIDLVSLYDIQDALDADAIYGDKLGRFCYSLSDTRTPVNDEVDTALRAGRMFKFQEGSIIKFGRDELNAIRTTLFTRRIKKPDSETKTIRQYLPNDFNGVTLDWTDEETGEGNTILFPESTTPSNPKRVTAAGIKNYEQAWNTANIEMNKLILRRTTVKTVVQRDGLLVFPNARIGNVDSTTLSTVDGEITAFSGLTATTNDPVDFDGNLTATVHLRNENGTSTTQIVEPRTDGIDGFIFLVTPSEPITVRGDGDCNQMGTLYRFIIVGDIVTDYLVQEITPGDDGYVNLTLINYNEDIYDPDTTVPTPE